MSWHLAMCVLGVGAPWLVPEVSDAPSHESRLASWREALELDLAREVLTDGLSETLPGGALERDALAISLVARALMQSGDLERARALLARASADLGSQAELDLARARLALEDDALDRALDLLLAGPREPKTPLSVRHAEIPESYLLAARALVRAGDLERAAPFCERFLELAPYDPAAPAAWHMLAQSAIAKRDLESARRCKHNAEASAQWQAYYKTRRLQARAHPDDPLPRYGIAELWLAVGQHAHARPHLEWIADSRFEAEPRFLAAHLSLARVLRDTDPAEAARRLARYRALGGREDP